MKPTNIFTNVEYFQKFSTSNNSTKKPSKKHHHSYSKSASETGIMGEGENEKKIILGENEDKNLSLSVILNREFDF